jgi:hypothetical protein
MGQQSSTNSSAAFSSQALQKGFYVKNISTGGQVVYLSHTTATTANGYQLFPGETSPLLETTNMNNVNHIASASGGNLAWYGA